MHHVLQTSRPLPITRDLVLLGGGHAHALVLKKWVMAPVAGARLTLIDPQVKAPYTGMLPGFVAGHYQREALDIDLVKLARQAGARLISDRAIGLDTKQKRVQLQTYPDIAYDTLSIDIGITSGLGHLPGASTFLIPAKPLGPFADVWTERVADAAAHQTELDIAILGAGVAGVELALAMAHRLDTSGVTGTIKLIEAAPIALAEVNATTRRKLLRELATAKVEIVTHTTVTGVDENGVLTDKEGERIDANLIVSAAGAQPHPWLQDTALILENGYIAVDPTLRSINTPGVFAAGDCAHLTHAPRPKAGVFAVRQAPVLFDNLGADLTGRPLRKFAPQRSYLKLISTGRKSAVTDKWGIGLSGRVIWALKDRIDQAFMNQFRSRTEMPPPSLPENSAIGLDNLLQSHAHQCGACGAKVAQSTLLEGLASTAPNSLDDAAILERGDGFQVFTTDHLRAFNADPYLLAKVAAVHALGDVWAMGAAPQTALSQLILPPLSPDKQADMLREIMAGAKAVFDPAGVTVSGGHTSSGAELTIGFSIMGEREAAPITLAGARTGDVLVLTKPIGTGVLLAAEMQQNVDGEDYVAAIASMCRPQATASRLLATSAHAMTDVTGFGLAGHLLNILNASDVAANLDMDAVPLLNGAETLAKAGVRSTLWPANADLTARMTLTPSPRTDLLFDPQTCGGLLAAIPETKIAAILAGFADAQEPIWMIGDIAPGPPHIQVKSAQAKGPTDEQ